MAEKEISAEGIAKNIRSRIRRKYSNEEMQIEAHIVQVDKELHSFLFAITTDMQKSVSCCREGE